MSLVLKRNLIKLRIFNALLKEKRCYGDFRVCKRNTDLTIKSIYTLRGRRNWSSVRKDDMFIRAFRWSNSSNGYSFWYNLNEIWIKNIKVRK